MNNKCSLREFVKIRRLFEGFSKIHVWQVENQARRASVFTTGMKVKYTKPSAAFKTQNCLFNAWIVKKCLPCSQISMDKSLILQVFHPRSNLCRDVDQSARTEEEKNRDDEKLIFRSQRNTKVC